MSHDVFEQLLQSYDEGVAEFLGLGAGQAEHPRQRSDAAGALTALVVFEATGDEALFVGPQIRR